jgi:hypothetical protein
VERIHTSRKCSIRSSYESRELITASWWKKGEDQLLHPDKLKLTAGQFACPGCENEIEAENGDQPGGYLTCENCGGIFVITGSDPLSLSWPDDAAGCMPLRMWRCFVLPC